MKNHKKKIVVRIAAGLGNQMFMYANALSVAKKNHCDLLIDDESGFFQKKNSTFDRDYKLFYFNLSSKLAPSKFKFNNYWLHLIRKISIFFDRFNNDKKFQIEHKDSNKITSFKSIKKINTNLLYIEGNYESEKYFMNIKKDINKEFLVKKKYLKKNSHISLLKNNNSISIHIRRGRFHEPDYINENKSNYTGKITFIEMIKYIQRGIKFFKNKIDNPKFFIWSNNFNNLEKFFDPKEFIFIKGNNTMNDFNLFNYCKHFIVSPSSFHWWGAWLNRYPNKICCRPRNLNPSNNKNFWPGKWHKI
jgi:hypothetical protein